MTWYFPGQISVAVHSLLLDWPAPTRRRGYEAFLAERSVLAGWCLRWLCFRHGRTAANTALCLEYLRSSGSTKGGMRQRWKATPGGSVWAWTADGDGVDANGADSAPAAAE